MSWCLMGHGIGPIKLLDLCSAITWWRHQMEIFSALLALCAGNSPVTGEFPSQRPVKRSFDVFFDIRLNKRLRKHSWGWWFETTPRPLWRHCNGVTCLHCWTSVRQLLIAILFCLPDQTIDNMVDKHARPGLHNCYGAGSYNWTQGSSEVRLCDLSAIKWFILS